MNFDFTTRARCGEGCPAGEVHGLVLDWPLQKSCTLENLPKSPKGRGRASPFVKNDFKFSFATTSATPERKCRVQEGVSFAPQPIGFAFPDKSWPDRRQLTACRKRVALRPGVFLRGSQDRVPKTGFPRRRSCPRAECSIAVQILAYPQNCPRRRGQASHTPNVPTMAAVEVRSPEGKSSSLPVPSSKNRGAHISWTLSGRSPCGFISMGHAVVKTIRVTQGGNHRVRTNGFTTHLNVTQCRGPDGGAGNVHFEPLAPQQSKAAQEEIRTKYNPYNGPKQGLAQQPGEDTTHEPVRNPAERRGSKRVCRQPTKFFRVSTFLQSSPGSSIGVSAMKAAWARRRSLSRMRNVSLPMVPFPMC